jgi:hypothetical protein
MDAKRQPLDEDDQREDPLPYNPAELSALSEEIRAHDAYSRFMNFPQLLHTIVERMAQRVDDNGMSLASIPSFTGFVAHSSSPRH